MRQEDDLGGEMRESLTAGGFRLPIQPIDNPSVEKRASTRPGVEGRAIPPGEFEIAGTLMPIMEIPNWLAVSGALMGLCGGAAGLISAAVHALSHRIAKVDALRTTLGRPWTNEGAIDSKDTVLITLDLKTQDGDVFGSLQTSARERLLSANLAAHLWSGTLTISETRGRSIRTVAVVRLRLKGNRNRVEWKVISGNAEHWIPDKTLLWPSEVGVDSWRLH
jgi:hypothetical protein